MAISLANLQSGKTDKPARMLVYGVAGIGKTTLGVNAPSPVFIQTEDGLNADCATFGVMRTLDDVMGALQALYVEEHDFKTLVVDSLDWLEPLIWDAVCNDHGVKNIEDLGFGKGYVHAVDKWRTYLEALNYLRNERGMTIIQIAHAQIKRFDDPATEAYDRYLIKLHSKAAAVVEEHVDAVLFANYQISTVEKDTGFGKKRTRAVGGGRRVLHTQERPAYQAKNRFGMPETVELSWDAVAPYLPGYGVPQQPVTSQPTGVPDSNPDPAATSGEAPQETAPAA